ncbi:nitrate- and nitrite sensing domain-containing protein [Streptomyces sp. NPDC060194]|uniref:sensor histidine kinase n=1 Tax=Streptomyces sp. NPDC060194 TaxID=3347069 RepID=UPI0036525B26
MQGRFKRDGSAAAEPEPRGGNDRGSSPQHAQNPSTQGRNPGRNEGGDPDAATAAEGRPPAAAPPAKPQGTGSRIALRNWRISTRLVSLLVLPVVAATSLGALRINESLDDIEQLEDMELLTEMTQQATELATALQNERDLSAGPLSNGLTAKDYEVSVPRERTDNALRAFDQATKDIQPDGNEALAGVRSNVYQISQSLRELKNIRDGAYENGNPASRTVDAYSQLIQQLLNLSQDMAQATNSPEMIQQTRALAAFSKAKEYASVQRALVAANLTKTGAKADDLSSSDLVALQNALRAEDDSLTAFNATYEGDEPVEELTKQLETKTTTNAVESYVEIVANQSRGLKSQEGRSYKEFTDDYTGKISDMTTIETSLLSKMEQQAGELRDEAERSAIINGALILLVIGVSLVGAFVVSRSMIRSLRRLQDTATRVAQDRLPELVKQLSEADPQDVDTSVESVGVHSRDEIGKVAAAFDDVHREAVRLAAEQALLRGNVNAMFTNLSRRSQGLIQRQLSLISELESREADPDQLSSLFKLDHLATRMRRNGENLLVLAGEEPGRRWTRPVPLVDVLRAAASEVEQYERIELASVPATEVAGRVVNDLVHLLAELLENATSFSSPQTKVKVTGHALPDGRVLVEIHDTGIGLSPEDLAAINERLAAPPTVDVSVSRRMGLFVVGRLSQRHGIRIQLRPSDSGGTTALVMLPVDVAQGKGVRKPAPGKAGGPALGGGQGQNGQNGQNGQGGPGLLGGAPARGQVEAGGARAALPGRPDEGNGFGGGSGQRPPAPGPVGAGAGGAGAAFGRGAQPQNASLEGGFNPGGALPQRGGPQGQAGPAPAPQGRPGQQQPGQDRQFGGQGGPGQQSGNRAPGYPQQPAPQRPQAPQQQPQQQAPQQPPQGGAPFTPQAPVTPAPAGPGGFPGAPVPPVPVRAEQQPPHPMQNRPRRGGPGAAGGRPTGPLGTDPTRQPQLPPPGGPRAELPGGSRPAGEPPRTTSWGNDNAQPPVSRASLDAPRGHDADDRQGAGRPPQQSQQQPGNGQYVRQDVFGGGAQPGRPAGPAHPAPGQNGYDTAGFPVVRPDQPEALPPAGPGDGRTPLYDTLETNWFHGGHEQQAAAEQSERPAPPRRAPQRPQNQNQNQQQPQQVQGNGQQPAPVRADAAAGWRPSPNDELVKQAERVRQPAAGGITTSGLPRRVPRANLVAGTAQQETHHTGPQVSRAPADVRGRLTNLRRGIQQGRQAGSGLETGAFRTFDPSHQQER